MWKIASFQKFGVMNLDPLYSEVMNPGVAKVNNNCLCFEPIFNFRFQGLDTSTCVEEECKSISEFLKDNRTKISELIFVCFDSKEFHLKKTSLGTVLEFKNSYANTYKSVDWMLPTYPLFFKMIDLNMNRLPLKSEFELTSKQTELNRSLFLANIDHLEFTDSITAPCALTKVLMDHNDNTIRNITINDANVSQVSDFLEACEFSRSVTQVNLFVGEFTSQSHEYYKSEYIVYLRSMFNGMFYRIL
jgi:hypothetical protein